MSIRKFFTTVGISYFLLILLYFGITNLLALVIQAVVPDSLSTYPLLYWIVAAGPQYLIAMPVCACVMRRLPSVNLAKNSLGGGMVWFSLLCMDMLIVQIGNVIGSRVNTFIGNLSGQDVSSGIESVLSGGNLLLTFLIVVIIGPVMEELIFRKVLIDRTIVFGDWTAILLSGMIFGLAHGSFEQLFYAFGSGCLYAYIYIKTGKVRYTISLHMVTNFLTGFLLILISPDTTDLTRLVNGNDSINSGVFPGYVLYMIVVLVLSFIGLILFIRAVRKKKVKMVPGKYSMPAGRTAKAVFGNVGIILFLIIVAFMFVIKIVA